MCQGSASCSILALPPVHDAAATDALLTYPSRRPAVFAIDAEWKLPSSVTGHAIDANPAVPVNLSGLKTSLQFWLLIDMWLPNAVLLVTAAINTAPATIARAHLLLVNVSP